MTLKNSSARPIRLVLDTNVYIAAASPDSFIAQFIFSEHRGINPYDIYVSPAILQELEAKLTANFDYPKPKAISFIKDILKKAVLVYPTTAVFEVKNDPDDNRILECAVEAKADMLISADQDLLRLKAYAETKIVHPSQLKYIFPDNF